MEKEIIETPEEKRLREEAEEKEVVEEVDEDEEEAGGIDAPAV